MSGHAASETPLEERYDVLCRITRAQHFAWRAAVRELCPELDPALVVRRMWERAGAASARAYLRRLDRASPLPIQIARGIAWSSRCMGEDAVAEHGPGEEAFVRHRACPWLEHHRREGLEAEDRLGCDVWFQTIAAEVSAAVGCRLRVETIEALPDGAPSCWRRLWLEPPVPVQPEQRA